MIALAIAVVVFWVITIALFWFFFEGQNDLEDNLLEILNDQAAEIADLKQRTDYLNMRLEALSRCRVMDRSADLADDWK